MPETLLRSSLLPFFMAFDGFGAELMRPWKLLSLLLGLVLLTAGARWYRFDDWDIGISLIMGVSTYLLASPSIRLLLSARYGDSKSRIAAIVAALLAGYLVADGEYVLYNTLMQHRMARWENFMVSFPTFFLMGFIWLYKGTVLDFLEEIRRALAGPRRS
ncbi:hypothetical protein KK141_05790 [Dyella sp. LX-66]|uniref:hypothetical protein n=1 Tax=unclassified Dyella TaxID=2634549 RepID=UPI001BE092F4|nr:MULTISPECIES: hypothetical protein [unclassified Dyella]MBT2116782.1 hypothetical protein [Dyella sp. LX-1]MBT2139038.1 hypothetical protein [Dyella sp. LX-66]